ncbi:MAG: PAS domain S-box protein [Bacteroidia bacterium]
MSAPNFEINLLPSWLINSTNIYAIVTDLQGNYIYVNNRFIEKFGFISSNFIGQSIVNTIHLDDIEKCATVVNKCIEQPTKTHSVEIRKPHNNHNEYFYSNWEFSCFFDSKNEIIGILCIGYDLTKEKKLTNILLETQSKLNSLLNSTNEGFIFLNNEFKVLYFNKSAEENYAKRYLNKEIKTADNFLSYCVTEEEKSELEAIYRKVIEGNQIQFVQEQNNFWFQISLFNVVTEDGKTLGIAYGITDITQHKKDQLQILEQNKKLKEIAWQQSHEVRSPVVNLLGITSILNNENSSLSDEDKAVLLKAINTEIVRLDQIIKSIVEKTNWSF